MNHSFGARRQLRVPAIVAGLAVFLQLLLVPAAFATVTDAFGSAYDLTAALSSNPFTFSDSASSVTAGDSTRSIGIVAPVVIARPEAIVAAAVESIALAVASSAAVVWLFGHVLGMALPRGPWGW